MAADQPAGPLPMMTIFSGKGTRSFSTQGFMETANYRGSRGSDNRLALLARTVRGIFQIRTVFREARMPLLPIALGCAALLTVAYLVYGRLLTRLLRLDPKAETP